MNRDRRHYLIQRLLWSGLGVRFVRLMTGVFRRWNYVVLNRSLHSSTNGEYWLISQLPARPCVLDVGFNTGDFTREVLSQRAEAKIIGFDPAREVQRVFTASFNQHPQVELVPCALAERSGVATFYDSGNMSSSLAPARGPTEATYSVPLMTLDEFATQRQITRIDLLKIDAEGFDLNVLEGAEKLLRQQQIDLFVFEYADGWINNRRFLKEASDYLSDKPYHLFRLFNGFLVPFTYATEHERHDLGCMYVGVSHVQQQRAAIPNRVFPL